MNGADQERVVLVRTRTNQGSGVHLSASLVLTCEHVVGAAENPSVNGTACVRVIGADKKADLALLEVTPLAGYEEPEWTEIAPHGAGLTLHGYPDGRAGRASANIRAVYETAAEGRTEYELFVGVKPGASGGLAVLDSDPRACVGVVQVGGKWANLSSVIAVGRIRQFLSKYKIELRPWHPGGCRYDEQEYLRLLREQTGFIDVRALKIEAGGAHKIPCEELYIPLTGLFAAHEMNERLDRGDQPPRERVAPSPASAERRGVREIHLFKTRCLRIGRRGRWTLSIAAADRRGVPDFRKDRRSRETYLAERQEEHARRS